MGAVDTPEAGVKHKKGGLRRRKSKRIGVKIDMTPMVDVAFLLLIFFMCTTVFRKPQALEINLPPKDNPPIPIAKSNILTLLVLPGDRFFWFVGEHKPEEATFTQLPSVFKQEKAKNPNKIVVVIKIHEDAKFHNMVDIIDELDVLKMTRFALAPMTDQDKASVGAGPAPAAGATTGATTPPAGSAKGVGAS